MSRLYSDVVGAVLLQALFCLFSLLLIIQLLEKISWYRQFTALCLPSIRYSLQSFADRREGEKVLAEIDQSYKKLSGFLEALTKHKGRGDRLAELLEEAKKFYTLQLRDVTVVEDVSSHLFISFYCWHCCNP